MKTACITIKCCNQWEEKLKAHMENLGQMKVCACFQNSETRTVGSNLLTRALGTTLPDGPLSLMPLGFDLAVIA
jgi:hypothetical protein